MLALMVAVALLLDRILGEPSHKWHPLVWFGNAAHRLEKRFNQADKAPWTRFSAGLLALLLLVGVPVLLLISLLMLLPLWANIALQIVVLMFCIGWQSLREHALAIGQPLTEGDLITARNALSMIVSRDTQTLNETQIASATCESVLENGHDAVFASLFWFALLGAPGALMHRLTNTLDGMWGYRNDRFEYFGKAAARCDDLLGYLPARLTALSYALVSKNTCKTLVVAWKQGRKHGSPNAGIVMAAGAAGLGIRLGGSASYQGIKEHRPFFGWGKRPKAQHIEASLLLIQKAVIVWLVILTALSL